MNVFVSEKLFQSYFAGNSFVNALILLTGVELELPEKTNVIFEKEAHVGNAVL